MAQREEALIRLENVGKTYKSGEIAYEALRDVNISIYEGEYVAIVGPSGSGKSTCMNIIGLLDELTVGSYHLAGIDVSHLDEYAKANYRNKFIGFIFQSFNLLADDSLLDNVALPLFYAKVPEAERHRRAKIQLERMGLGDYIYHKPNELSGGQKQRGAIARALITEPKLILADEPTGNLDSHSAGEVLDLFDELVAQGSTIVLITHDNYAARRAVRSIQLLDGQVSTQELATLKE